MRKIDLSNHSLTELKALRQDINKAINTAEKAKKQAARKAVAALAREHGYKLTDLVRGGSRNTKPATPKYRNPDNPNLTWTGRSRRPGWVKDALAKGKKLDSFAVK